MPSRTAHRTPTAFFPHFPPEWIRRGPARLRLWLERQRQRAALARLDDRLLDDIGIRRGEALAEARRWD